MNKDIESPKRLRNGLSRLRNALLVSDIEPHKCGLNIQRGQFLYRLFTSCCIADPNENADTLLSQLPEQ